MCGNYNHNSSDDNLMPNKKPAKDVIQLGNSWKSEGDSDPGCQPDTRPDIHPNCTAEEEKLFEAQCAEVILSDRFKPCHSLVPPEAFLGNCVYDMCEYDGMHAVRQHGGVRSGLSERGRHHQLEEQHLLS
ncbi:von Willebrand factor-like [Seriola lalandi dorsalis]|uniref:von Willebrand factor-like n=1 Tax=Seriola lalandi dorsalis TaxID=1841481 RepID=UPI000C6FB463|nr:von Willebrand factor-like [Seriola lalandi dorsalis]